MPDLYISFKDSLIPYLLEHFLELVFPSLDKYSMSDRSSPILMTPPIIAMVAGIAPFAITMSSTATAVSLLSGYSMP